MSERGPVVVGYDGSAQAQDALALANLLGSSLDLGAISLSVLTYAPTEATWVEYERMLREDETRLVTEARRGLGAIGELEAIAKPGPSPARELHELAAERSASLIVVGSTHRGAIGRVFPGTVADRLLTAAPCPVAVAPRGYAHDSHELRSIAVAYDGSPESEAALELGCWIASRSGGSLRLICVANPRDAITAVPMAGGWGAMASTDEGVEAERERMAGALERGLRGVPEGIDAIGEVMVDPSPETVIIETSVGADLLLIGSRGYGPIGRVLLGGVASHVVREAVCPVVVTARSAVETTG